MKKQPRVPHVLPTDRAIGSHHGTGASRGTEGPRDREEHVGPGAAVHERTITRVGALFENRMLDALAKSLVCFAILHQVVLATHLVQHRDWSVLNVFTMLEAQKLFPELAEGAAMQWVSLGFGLVVVPTVLVAILVFFAVLESSIGWCAGCWAFGRLMQWGLIPEETCEACNNLALARR